MASNKTDLLPMTRPFTSKRFSTRSKQRFASERSAFTLLEVVLALGLTLVFMAALYSALDVYRRFETAGQDSRERGQVARALFRKIEIDIRSAVLPGKPSAPISAGDDSDDDENDDESNPSDEDDTVTTLKTVDPAQAFSKGTVGLVGDRETLVLNIVRPSRPTMSSSPADASPLSPDGPAPLPSADAKSVAYFLAVDGARGVRGLVAPPLNPETEILDDVQGLARLEGNGLIISMSSQPPDSELIASQARVLAPEVNRLEFNYFNGLKWVESWNSQLAGSLPSAVRIGIGFRSSATVDPTSEQLFSDSDEYECVVAIPIVNLLGPE